MTPQALMEERCGVAAPGRRRKESGSARRGTIRILLVSAAAGDLAFLRRSLASMPGLRSGVAFDVTAAADFGAAARQIARTRFHLLFLDEPFCRPGSPGALGRIRALGYSGPVIGLTDGAGSSGLGPAATGADEFISKGTDDPGQLRRVILHVIGRRLNEAGAEEEKMAAGTIEQKIGAEAAAAIPRLPEPEAPPAPERARPEAGPAAAAAGVHRAAGTHSDLMIEIRELLAGMPPFVDERALSGEAIEALVNRRRTMLQRLETLAEENGRVLFNGEWVTPEEARRNYRRMKWRFRGYVVEVLLLYTVLIAGVLGLGAVMLWFTGLAR